MVSFRFTRPVDAPYRILCLGAHSDDIEIGCGGTLLTLLERYSQAECYWVVYSADEQRACEARESASSFLKEARTKNVVIKDFRESFFPYVGAAIKECFEQLKREWSPDVIFTHYRNDLHQDHRLISELTWNTFRNHLILEYEIPKYDGDLGSPNFFVPLDRANAKKKVRYIVESFRSQNDRSWFDEDTFLSMLRLRGMECNAASRYAEGFYCRKIVLE